ncbi:MAG: hypothetical protein AAB649_07495, partial [Patescibacteria group bacterium]
TPFERDNGQLELVEDTINGYVCQTPCEAAQAMMKLTTEKTYNRISKANSEKARSWFSASELTERLENYIRGTSSPSQYPLSMDDYIKQVKPESQLYLLSLWAEYVGKRIQRKLGFV